MTHYTTYNMKYRLICFDFDGTLVQTTSAILASVKLAYQHLNQTAPSSMDIEEAIKKGKPTKIMLQLLSPWADENLIHELFKACTQSYLKQSAQQTILFPHAREILIQLKEMGIAISIISNKSPTEIKAALSHFKLAKYIDLVIGAEPEGLCKPDPAIYEKLLQPSFPTIQRENILMVGDTLTDIQFAKAIEIDMCWVKYGEGNATDCHACNPRYSIESLKELTSIILNEATSNAF